MFTTPQFSLAGWTRSFFCKNSPRRPMADFECPICTEKYTQARFPYLLGCGHTLCSPCLEQSLRITSGGAFGLMTTTSAKCPTCRAPIATKTKNYSLLGTIDEYQKRLKDLETSKSSQNREKMEVAKKLEAMQVQMALLKSEKEAIEARSTNMMLSNSQASQQQIETLQDKIDNLHIELGKSMSLQAQVSKALGEKLQKLEGPATQVENQPETQIPKNDRCFILYGLTEQATEASVRRLFGNWLASVRIDEPRWLGTAVITAKADSKETSAQILENFECLKREKKKLKAFPLPGEAPPKFSPAFDNQNTIPVKHKLLVRGLPKDITKESAARLFDSLQTFLWIRVVDDMAHCVAEFRDESHAEMAIWRWDNQCYPGTNQRISVEYWRVVKSNKDNQGIVTPKKPNEDVVTSPSLSAYEMSRLTPFIPTYGTQQLPTSSQPENLRENPGPAAQRSKNFSECSKASEVGGEPEAAVSLKNLPPWCSEDDVKALISPKATVTTVKFVSSGDNHRVAKVTLGSVQAAKKLVEELRNTKFPGTKQVLRPSLWMKRPSKPDNRRPIQDVQEDGYFWITVSGLALAETRDTVHSQFGIYAPILQDFNGKPRINVRRAGTKLEAQIAYGTWAHAYQVFTSFNKTPKTTFYYGGRELQYTVRMGK